MYTPYFSGFYPSTDVSLLVYWVTSWRLWIRCETLTKTETGVSLLKTIHVTWSSLNHRSEVLTISLMAPNFSSSSVEVRAFCLHFLSRHPLCLSVKCSLPKFLIVWSFSDTVENCHSSYALCWIYCCVSSTLRDFVSIYCSWGISTFQSPCMNTAQIHCHSQSLRSVSSLSVLSSSHSWAFLLFSWTLNMWSC